MIEANPVPVQHFVGMPARPGWRRKIHNGAKLTAQAAVGVALGHWVEAYIKFFTLDAPRDKREAAAIEEFKAMLYPIVLAVIALRVWKFTKNQEIAPPTAPPSPASSPGSSSSDMDSATNQPLPAFWR